MHHLAFWQIFLINFDDMDNERIVLAAHEFQLIDSNGNIRVLLTTSDNGVVDLTFTTTKGKGLLKLSTSDDGLSSVNMYDDSGKEKVGIAVDDKGTHVHLAGEDKQESYLFLKNSGASGIVLTDRQGNRRLEAKVGPDAEPAITIYTLSGEVKKL
jgi:hypothetical protein